MWHVGQRIVCVDDSGFEHEDGVFRPKKGVVYTIRNFDEVRGIECLRLKEIINPIKKYVEMEGETMFRLTRFKPLDEKRLDIFREMLTVKEREKEIVE